MALTDPEKASLAELLGIPHPDLVAFELATITASQEIILKADVARWQVIRGTYGSLNGKNASGVEFDPGDERSDLRRRVIRLLNVSELVDYYRGRSAGNRIVRA